MKGRKKKRDHTWSEWSELNNTYVYRSDAKGQDNRLHAIEINCIAKTKPEAHVLGFISLICTLHSRGIPVPKKFKESEWLPYLKKNNESSTGDTPN